MSSSCNTKIKGNFKCGCGKSYSYYSSLQKHLKKKLKDNCLKKPQKSNQKEDKERIIDQEISYVVVVSIIFLPLI